MHVCIADITTLHCLPELQLEPYVYPKPQQRGQDGLPRLLCHDDLYCFWAFCHLNVPVSQLHLDLGVSISDNCTTVHRQPLHSVYLKLKRCNLQCGRCQWRRSWMVHVQCRLHEQQKHSWSGTSSCCWPNQDLSYIQCAHKYACAETHVVHWLYIVSY